MADDSEGAAAGAGEGKAGEAPLKLKPKKLGRTGVYVSELCLGTMTFGTKDRNAWGLPTADQDTSFAMMNRFAEVGGNFLDTADVYGTGEAEEVVGRWLATQDRDEFVVATKVRGRMGPGLNNVGLSRKHIMESVDRSLKRLQTDYIDLYQVHTYDVETPLEETFSALNDLVRCGKVRYIGISNYLAWHIAKSVELCKSMGLEKAVCLQPQYSLLARGADWDLIPVCKEYGMGIIPWSPLAGGWLSGRYTREMTAPDPDSRVAWAQKAGWKPTNWDDMATETTWNVVDQIKGIAEELGGTASPAQVALRWVMQTDGITAPIIGAKKLDHLEDNLRAAALELSDEQMARLNDASAMTKPYPWNQYWAERRDSVLKRG